MTQETNNQNNIQMGIIVALLVIIAVMGFFLGKSSNSNVANNTNTPAVQGDYEELSITVYDDKRCTNCATEAIIEQLKLLPSVANVQITVKDFADAGVEDYLSENSITTLPLFVFSTNNFDVTADPVDLDQNGQATPKLNSFLVVNASGAYTLDVGSNFNPFETRSENGFLVIDEESLKTIKDNSYIKGNSDAKITWIEYSDLECPYCAKLHNAGTVEALEAKYGDDLNIIYNHFPLGFHANAQPGAEILECLWEAEGSDAFYALIKKAYTDKKSDKAYLIQEAVALWASESDLNECLDSAKFTTSVQDGMARWTELFGITGTPGNAIINNETGEFEVISWAYPTSSFEEIIDNLLK